MDQQYSHLSVEERAVIMIERSRGVSLRSISRMSQVKKNTVTMNYRYNGIPGP